MTPKMRGEIQRFLGLKDRKHLRQAILSALVKNGLLDMTIPDKPSSHKQQYVTTEKGKEFLKEIQKNE